MRPKINLSPTTPAPSPMSDAGPLADALKRREAAQRLGVSESTLKRWTREGAVPAYVLGSQYRWRKSDLDAFAEAGRHEAVTRP